MIRTLLIFGGLHGRLIFKGHNAYGGNSGWTRTREAVHCHQVLELRINLSHLGVYATACYTPIAPIFMTSEFVHELMP